MPAIARGWSDWIISARKPPTTMIGWEWIFQVTLSGPNSPQSARFELRSISARRSRVKRLNGFAIRVPPFRW